MSSIAFTVSAQASGACIPLQHAMQYLQEPEEEKEMASVPVDDEQPRCALSGEKFEKFWHDDHQVCGNNCATYTWYC